MALINCPESDKSISDKAATCPHCGAPNSKLATREAAPLADAVAGKGGTVCPFSGHQIPTEATVCVCGAYYGY